MHSAIASPRPLEGPEIERILGQGVTIPPQPRVLTEVDQLAGQPQVSVKKIAALIAKDPALLAGVFRVVNSPAMGLSRRVDSAETAITLLGFKQVANLMKSIAIRQALGGNSQAYEKFWERSGDIAQIAAIIAHKQVSVCNVFPDQAYMAGLFQDCGIPVLMQRFPGYCAGLGDGVWPDLEEEDGQFDTDHSVVGYLVGKHWRLPDFILGGIRYHHEILSVVHPARTVVAMLQMSAHILNLIMGQPDAPEWAASWQTILEELGIGQDGLREFEEDVIEAFTPAG